MYIDKKKLPLFMGRNPSSIWNWQDEQNSCSSPSVNVRLPPVLPHSNP